jgi:hypothetical protein
VGVQQEYLDGKNVEGKTWEHGHGHMHTLRIHMCFFQSRQFHHAFLRRQVLMVGFVAFLCRFACVGVVSNHGSESSGCEFDIRCSYKARKALSGSTYHRRGLLSTLLEMCGRKHRKRLCNIGSCRMVGKRTELRVTPGESQRSTSMQEMQGM